MCSLTSPPHIVHIFLVLSAWCIIYKCGYSAPRFCSNSGKREIARVEVFHSFQDKHVFFFTWIISNACLWTKANTKSSPAITANSKIMHSLARLDPFVYMRQAGFCGIYPADRRKSFHFDRRPFLFGAGVNRQGVKSDWEGDRKDGGNRTIPKGCNPPEMDAVPALHSWLRRKTFAVNWDLLMPG